MALSFNKSNIQQLSEISGEQRKIVAQIPRSLKRKSNSSLYQRKQ
jgi:hypothetical protein